MEPYPYVAGIRYPADLSDFTHIEDPELQAEWTIKLGAANVQMFRTLFAGMFYKTIELGTEPQADIDPEIEFIIEPKLEDVEFSVPQQSGTDQFVVWLRYNLKLFEADGQLISNWRITGYGQHDEGDMGLGAETAMQGAAIAALRDAAANIIVGFDKAPGVAEHILHTNDSPENSLPGSNNSAELPENNNAETNETAENEI